MKKNLYIIVYGLLLVFFVSSCEKDNVGETYTVATDEPTGLSLLWSTGTLTYKPNVTEATIPVIRRNASGALTVPIIATYDQTAFTIPTSVTFADGESQALIKFSIENAKLSKSYAISLALDVDTSKIVTYGTFNTGSTPATKPMSYGIRKTAITFLKDYEWVTLGQGTLNSSWFAQNGIAVQMQKAKGYDVYRAISIYYTGINMMITVSGTTATVAKQLVDSKYNVYAEGTGTFIDGVFTLSLDFKQYSGTTVVYQELGDVEVITLPK